MSLNFETILKVVDFIIGIIKKLSASGLLDELL